MDSRNNETDTMRLKNDTAAVVLRIHHPSHIADVDLTSGNMFSTFWVKIHVFRCFSLMESC